MIDYDENDRKTFVVESAIKNNLGSKEEIELYEQLILVMELMEDNTFNIEDSDINNGINFGITTKFPHHLPEKVGLLFFNINPKFSINIKETSKFVYNSERYFVINIRKN